VKTIVPSLNEDGQPRQHAAVSTDITGRKQAEETRQADAAHFKLIFESLPVGVAWAVNHPDGGSRASSTMLICKYAGSHASRTAAGDNRHLSHPEDSARQDEFRREVEAGRRDEYSMEKRYVRPDGKVVWVVFPCGD